MFGEAMHWKVIKPLIKIEDSMYLTNNRALTVPEGEFGGGVAKLDYVEQFDCLPFFWELEEFKFDCFKRRKVNRTTRRPVRNRKACKDKGRVDPTFFEKHDLHSDSRPSEWFTPWIPIELTNSWTTYTNTKAMMVNAGQKGKPYPDYEPFTVKELRQHIGVVMLQGIAPSPQVSK